MLPLHQFCFIVSRLTDRLRGFEPPSTSFVAKHSSAELQAGGACDGIRTHTAWVEAKYANR